MGAVMDASDVRRALRRIAHEIIERNDRPDDVILLGIPSRGVTLAERLGAALDGLDFPVPVGVLDTRPYRDDLGDVVRTERTVTHVPDDIEARTVILVDDVLFTGRTVRAALDALTDLGRPSRVQVAALVDRGHRELPIRADYVGRNLPTARDQHVAVRLAERDAVEGVWVEARPARTAATP
jgi:pyrimidine operon attenuation protein/uracil phosphoribosyltransferase